MAFIMGIDPSLTSTGLAKVKVSQDSCTLFQTTAIKTKDDRGDPRLFKIDSVIESWLETNTPSLVLIEDYAYGGHNGFSIGELGGVLKLRLHLSGVPYYTVASSRWRKALFGRGQKPKDSGLETKDWVLKELRNYIRHDFDTTDEAEATALAILGYYVFQVQNGLTLNQPKHLTKAVAEIISAKTD